MLFSIGHGQRVIVTPPAGGIEGAGAARKTADGKSRRPVVEYARAVGDTATPNGTESTNEPTGPFAYYFPDAAGPSHDPTIADRLATLAAGMVEREGEAVDGASDSAIPPVMTYLGQFIDHDITANTDRETASSRIEGPDLAPLPRDQVRAEVRNLRKGSLGVDSMYGDGPAQDAFAKKLEGLLRHPRHRAKMRLGTATPTGGRPPLPADPAADLLRLGRLVDEGSITVEELRNLQPPELAAGFLDDAGNPLDRKAIIGDGRNDENLIVAQLHVAFLRLHNVIVDWVASQPGAPPHEDKLFERARQVLRWHYQWLVVNAFLPAVCDPAVVERIKADGAPLYSAFYDANAGPNGRMPLPLEFSVAAFRYGHSMVRAEYDFNRNFGRPSPLVGFDLIFLFTGRGDSPLAGTPTLPENWIIEWDRFVDEAPDHPDRTARKIDTRLAPPLNRMLNEEGDDGRPDNDPANLFRRLAERNLRRGHRLNIPTAQACIEALNRGNRYSGADAIRALTHDEFTSGASGPSFGEAGFLEETPLWAYVLKEAEVRENGERLGPLGSVLVAETLVGLVVKDPTSYWHQGGSHHGRWGPEDGAKPHGVAIDSMTAMMRATGQLDGAIA